MATAKILSREDGNLNSSAIITSRNRLYSDIDLTFTAKTDGDIYKKVDAAAVKQAVKNAVLTGYYEKPFDPYFGTNIRELLFELADDETSQEIRESIQRAIELYEPRAIIQDIVVDNRVEDFNAINVSIYFQIVNSNQVVTLTTTLVRLR